MNKKIIISLFSLTLLSGCQFIGENTAKDSTDNTNKTTKTSTTEKDKATEEKAAIAPLPNVSTADWNLLLVNSDFPMDPTREIPLAVVDNGLQIDQRMEADYQAWMEAARNAGFNMELISAYRSIDLQQTVYDQSIQDNVAKGMSQEEALKETKEYVAFPGASEHHSALAIDIVDDQWLATGKGLIPEYDQTDSQKWLVKTMQDYGFILRFPKDKESYTKISYESWHFRYVGKENAKYIVDNHLSLEEYIERLKAAGK